MTVEDKVLEIFKKTIEENNLYIYYCRTIHDTYYISRKNADVYEDQKIINLEDFKNNFYELYNSQQREVHLSMDNKIKLNFLINLFKEEVPIKKIKKIITGHEHPFYSWNELKGLFLYRKDLNQEIVEVLNHYKGKISNYDFKDIFEKISTLPNTEKCLLNFTKTNLEWLKDNQLQQIENSLEITEDKSFLNEFKLILLEKDRVLNYDEPLFSNKENNFEYLNINASSLNKRFFIDANMNYQDYQIILNYSLGVLKSFKKKLGFENIYLENRTGSKNEFLISIETEKGINKDFFKHFITEYFTIFREEMFSVMLDNRATTFSKKCIYDTYGKMNGHKEKIKNYIELNYSLEKKEEKPKVKFKV